MNAYELAEVMLPKGSVYHVQLVQVHGQVWPDLQTRVFRYRWDGDRQRLVDDDRTPPFMLCRLDSHDGFISGTGGRRLCKTCEWGVREVERAVDELRWEEAVQIGYRQDDEVTRAFLGRVGW